MMAAERIAVVVGAIAAVLLQVVLAPYIAIGYAVPDFIAVFALLAAIVRPRTYGAVLPFVLGLLYDLLTGGPVGAMAFSLTAVSCLAARLFAALDNDTLFMPLALMGLGLFLVEAVYGAFLLALGYNVGIVEALAFRIAPCFVYDLVLGAVLYPVARRVLGQSGPSGTDIMFLR